jgi:hypothetical protein
MCKHSRVILVSRMTPPNTPNHLRGGLTSDQLNARIDAVFNLISPMSVEDVVAWYLREAIMDDSVLWTDLCSAFERLAEADPPKTKAIYVDLCQREDPKERWFGAFHIIYLTPLDHDLGMYFWEQFMGDPDPQVRQVACNAIEERLAVSDLEGQDDESFHELGITWQDACNLYRAYLNPRERGLYFGLGEAALHQLLSPPPTGTAQ